MSVCAALVAAAVFAAASPTPRPFEKSSPAPSAGSKPLRELARFPDVFQPNNYTCGVATVTAVATYYGFWGYMDEAAKAMGTTENDGTHPVRMVKYLKGMGLDAKLVEGLKIADLHAAVDAGHAVIVDFQAYGAKGINYAKAWEDGHYCVVVGYDAQGLYLEDPSLLATRGYLKNADFDARWHDYEVEKGKRRAYNHLGIVVKGKPALPPAVSPID